MLNLYHNQIDAKGAEYLAQALTNNRVSKFVFFFHYIFTIIFQHSHSSYSSLDRTKLMHKEQNIWLKH
jgi:hypothetical protein